VVVLFPTTSLAVVVLPITSSSTTPILRQQTSMPRLSSFPRLTMGATLTRAAPAFGSISMANGHCFNVQSNNPAGDTTWQLFSVAGGAGTQINAGAVGRALLSGDIVECRVVGSLVSGYINGVLEGSATDTTYTSGGAYGIHIFGNVGVWDDFEGGDFAL
jgi:hypothetical protein